MDWGGKRTTRVTFYETIRPPGSATTPAAGQTKHDGTILKTNKGTAQSFVPFRPAYPDIPRAGGGGGGGGGDEKPIIPSIPVATTVATTKRGSLRKFSLGRSKYLTRRNWRGRWFVVEGGDMHGSGGSGVPPFAACLRYYKDESHSKALHSINLGPLRSQSCPACRRKTWNDSNQKPQPEPSSNLHSTPLCRDASYIVPLIAGPEFPQCDPKLGDVYFAIVFFDSDKKGVATDPSSPRKKKGLLDFGADLEERDFLADTAERIDPDSFQWGASESSSEEDMAKGKPKAVVEQKIHQSTTCNGVGCSMGAGKKRFTLVLQAESSAERVKWVAFLHRFCSIHPACRLGEADGRELCGRSGSYPCHDSIAQMRLRHIHATSPRDHVATTLNLSPRSSPRNTSRDGSPPPQRQLSPPPQRSADSPVGGGGGGGGGSATHLSAPASVRYNPLYTPPQKVFCLGGGGIQSDEGKFRPTISPVTPQSVTASSSLGSGTQMTPLGRLGGQFPGPAAPSRKGRGEKEGGASRQTSMISLSGEGSSFVGEQV